MNVAAAEQPAQTRALSYRWVALLVALAVVVAAGALLQAFGTELRNLGVVAVPQRYVALSLPHPTSLPAQRGPGAPIAFDFAISNATATRIHQRWIVDVSGPGLPDQPIANGWARVKMGASVTIPVHLQMPDTHSEITVRISAPGRSLAPLEFHVAPAPDGGSP